MKRQIMETEIASQANFNLDFTVTEPVELRPEGGTNPNLDKVIENLLLASTHCWMQKGTRDVVHNTAKKGFLLEEIREAAEKLLTEVGQHFTNRRGSANRTKTDLLLDDILNCFLYIGGHGSPSEDYREQHRPCEDDCCGCGEGDSLEVSACIGLMEKGLNEVKNSIDNIIKNNNNIAVNLNKVPPIHVVGEEVVVAGVVARQCHGHLVDGGNQQQHKQRPWSAVVPGPQAENNKEMVECQRTTALTNFKYRTGQQARVHYYPRTGPVQSDIRPH